MRETYLTTILPQIPRLIGQQDRNPLSPTYGCFDRQFWHYKVTGMPSARYQEASLSLALLYGLKHKSNPYYQQPKIKRWALAGVRYWTTIQEKNGSFNEWYVREHSFVATAFSLYAMTEICLLLPESQPWLLRPIVRAAEWLCLQTELNVSNQQSGACIALQNVFLLTKNKKYRLTAEAKFTQIAAAQTKEGWIAEYGGADIGYSTVMADYLAKYYQKSGNAAAPPVLEKLLDFLDYFIHPGNSWGGEYGSRNTEYVLPHGVEACSTFSPAAQRVSLSLLQHLKKNPLNLDDRYLCQNGYTFLQAYLDSAHQKNDRFKYREKFTRLFPQSGLLVSANPHYYLVANMKKGGAIKIFDQKTQRLLFEHSGPLGRLSNGKVVSTQFIDESADIQKRRRQLSVSGNFKYVRSIVNSPLKQSAFTAAQSFGGAFPSLAKLMKQILRQILIVGQKSAPIGYGLHIDLQPKSVNLAWEINLFSPKVDVLQLFTQLKYSVAYIPSSRYFQKEVLGRPDRQLGQKEIQKLNQNRTLTFQRKFRF